MQQARLTWIIQDSYLNSDCGLYNSRNHEDYFTLKRFAEGLKGDALAPLRDSLKALQSASVSSLETKIVVSGCLLPKVAGSVGSGSHQEAQLPARVRLVFCSR